jgi:hypothetical protein
VGNAVENEEAEEEAAEKVGKEGEKVVENDEVLEEEADVEEEAEEDAVAEEDEAPKETLVAF